MDSMRWSACFSPTYLTSKLSTTNVNMTGCHLYSHNYAVYKHLWYSYGSSFWWGNYLKSVRPVVGRTRIFWSLHEYNHCVKYPLVHISLLFIPVAGLLISLCIHIGPLVLLGRIYLCHIIGILFSGVMSAVLVPTYLEKLTKSPPATSCVICGSYFWGI